MTSTRRHVLMVCLLFTPLAQGAEPPAPEGGAPLEQVVVEATRENLAKLGKEVQQSEYRFYKRYNDLNKNPDYAIHCANEALTGSRFKRTECQPVFQDKAEQEAARGFIIAFGGGEHVGSGGRPVGPPVAAGTYEAASVAIAAGRPGFRRNMLEVTRQSPELTKMAQEHAALWKRFYAMYRKLNGAGPAPEEKTERSR